MARQGHQGLSTEAEVLVAPSPPPGCGGPCQGLIVSRALSFPIVSPYSSFSPSLSFHLPAALPLLSLAIAPPQAVGTLVRRVSFRKERSMFWPQADRGNLITSKPSATLPADMKQKSSWPLSLWEQDTQTQILGGLERQQSPSATEKVWHDTSEIELWCGMVIIP